MYNFVFVIFSVLLVFVFLFGNFSFRSFSFSLIGLWYNMLENLVINFGMLLYRIILKCVEFVLIGNWLMSCKRNILVCVNL